MLDSDYKLEIGKVSRVGSLAVAPVYAADSFTEDVVMLDKAMKDERFSVKESGKVKNLLIENNLADKVFIACGMTIETTEKGSQNRYSKHPCLVMPNTQIKLPVQCVQQRRGLFRGSEGRYGGSTTIMMPSVRGGHRNDEEQISRDQNITWTRILDTTVILQRMNPTHDYVEAEKDADVKAYTDVIGDPEDGRVGLIAGVRDGNRTLYYTDFFGNRSILKRVHKKLAKSFGIVARVHEGNAEEIEKDDIAEFLENYRRIGEEHRQAHVGGGELYVIGEYLRASALLYGEHRDQIVQITMRQDYHSN